MAKEPKAAKDTAAKDAPKEPKGAKEPKAPKESKKVDARLRHVYKDRVIPALVKEFGYKNVMGVPKIEKVAINIGLGEATQNAKLMDEFLDRLMNVALPRVRDFRGVSPKSFDGRGNYTLGVKDQLIFPEIDYNKVDKAKGMNISITTTAKTDAEGLALLKHMGMPFRQ